MSEPEVSSDTRRFAADGSGVLHVVVDYSPRRQTYTALCGVLVPVRTATVYSDREPHGVLCAACRGAAPDP